MLKKLLAPLLLLVVLLSVWRYNTDSQILPPLPYTLSDQADPIAKTQLLIAGNHWVQKLSAHAARLEKALPPTFSKQLFYGKKNFSLRRLTHLLQGQPRDGLPEIIVWLGSDSELIEEVYHSEEATSWLLDYQKWQKTGKSLQDYRIYQLSPFINEDIWQNKSETWWKTKHLTHLKLFEAELLHLLTFLNEQQIKLIVITTPVRGQKQDIISKKHPSSFTPFANEILRKMSDQYGYILYDWAKKTGQEDPDYQALAKVIGELTTFAIKP